MFASLGIAKTHVPMLNIHELFEIETISITCWNIDPLTIRSFDWYIDHTDLICFTQQSSRH